MIRDNEEWLRADDACAQAGCDAFLLSSLADVTYVSGFEVPVPVGAGPNWPTASPWPCALWATPRARPTAG